MSSYAFSYSPLRVQARENVPSGEEPDGVRLLGVGHAEEGGWLAFRGMFMGWFFPMDSFCVQGQGRESGLERSGHCVRPGL